MTTKFRICEEAERGNGEFCVFTQAGFERLGRKSGYPRCIRHGRLFSYTVHAETREEARQKANPSPSWL
jgi:hypothetical protein